MIEELIKEGDKVTQRRHRKNLELLTELKKDWEKERTTWMNFIERKMYHGMFT